MQGRIHVIDHDYRRRAQIARQLFDRNLHAVVYEDLAQFEASSPAIGFVFAADGSPGGDSANDIIKGLEQAGCPLPVILYASQPTPERIVSAMLDGALDYLEWPFNPLLLDEAFRRLATEGLRRLERERLKAAAESAVQRLSPRELDVLKCIVSGKSNKEAAENLEISPRTVEIHRGNMMRKLNALSPSDAVRIAIYAGLDDELDPLEERMLARDRRGYWPMHRP